MKNSSEYSVVNIDWMTEFTDLEMENPKRVKDELYREAARQIAQQIMEQGLGEVKKQYDIYHRTTKFNTRIRVLVKKS